MNEKSLKKQEAEYYKRLTQAMLKVQKPEKFLKYDVNKEPVFENNMEKLFLQCNPKPIKGLGTVVFL